MSEEKGEWMGREKEGGKMEKKKSFTALFSLRKTWTSSIKSFNMPAPQIPLFSDGESDLESDFSSTSHSVGSLSLSSLSSPSSYHNDDDDSDNQDDKNEENSNKDKESDSDSDQDEDEDQEFSSKNMVKASAKLDARTLLNQVLSEKELLSASKDSEQFILPPPQNLMDDSDQEESLEETESNSFGKKSKDSSFGVWGMGKMSMGESVGIVQSRIQEIARVLNNFKELREPSR